MNDIESQRLRVRVQTDSGETLVDEARSNRDDADVGDLRYRIEPRQERARRFTVLYEFRQFSRRSGSTDPYEIRKIIE
jgi:hypothetical protein